MDFSMICGLDEEKNLVEVALYYIYSIFILYL